jgi:hypothetical protein
MKDPPPELLHAKAVTAAAANSPPSSNGDLHAAVSDHATAIPSGPVIREAGPLVHPPSQRRRPSIVATGAFLAGSLALLAFSIPGMDLLTIPLAGVGTLLGLVAVMIAANEDRGRLLAYTGAGVSAATLIVAWIFPQLIDPTRDRRVALPPVDLHKKVAIPFSGQGTEVKDLKEQDWADADKGVVEFGEVWLRLTSVNLEQVEHRLDGKSAFTNDKLLVIRVQLANNGVTRKIDYQSWADTTDGPAIHTPILKDSTGREYRQKPLGPAGAVPGQIRQGFMFPSKWVDDVLIFETPSRFDYLRLELPAAAFGGNGTVRLQIPRGMVKSK